MADKTTVDVNANSSFDGKNAKIDVNATINQGQTNSVPSINQIESGKAATPKPDAAKSAAPKQEINQKKPESGAKSMLADLNKTLIEIRKDLANYLGGEKKEDKGEASEAAKPKSDPNNKMIQAFNSPAFKTDFSKTLAMALAQGLNDADVQNKMIQIISTAAAQNGSDVEQGSVPDTSKYTTATMADVSSKGSDQADALSEKSSTADLSEVAKQLAEDSKVASQNLNQDTGDATLNALNKDLQNIKLDQADIDELALQSAVAFDLSNSSDGIAAINAFIQELAGGKFLDMDLKNYLQLTESAMQATIDQGSAQQEETSAGVEKIEEAVEEEEAPESEEIEEEEEGEEAEIEEEGAAEETESGMGAFQTALEGFVSSKGENLTSKEFHGFLEDYFNKNEALVKEIMRPEATDLISSEELASDKEDLISSIEKQASVLMPSLDKMTEGLEGGKNVEAPEPMTFAGIDIDKIAGSKGENGGNDVLTNIYGEVVTISQTLRAKGAKEGSSAFSEISGALGDMANAEKQKLQGEKKSMNENKEGGIASKLLSFTHGIMDHLGVIKEENVKAAKAKKLADSYKGKGTPGKKAGGGGLNMKELAGAMKSALKSLPGELVKALTSAKMKMIMMIIGLVVALGLAIWAFFKNPELLKKIGKAIAKIWEWIKTALSWLWTKMLEFIKKSSVKVLAIVAILLSIVSLWLFGPWGLIVGAVVFIGALIYKFKDKIWGFLKSIGKGLWNGIKWLGKTIWDIVTWPHRMIVKCLKWVWDKLCGLFPGVTSKIGGWVKGLLGKIPFIGRFFKGEENDEESAAVDNAANEAQKDTEEKGEIIKKKEQENEEVSPPPPPPPPPPRPMPAPAPEQRSASTPAPAPAPAPRPAPAPAPTPAPRPAPRPVPAPAPQQVRTMPAPEPRPSYEVRTATSSREYVSTSAPAPGNAAMTNGMNAIIKMSATSEKNYVVTASIGENVKEIQGNVQRLLETVLRSMGETVEDNKVEKPKNPVLSMLEKFLPIFTNIEKNTERIGTGTSGGSTGGIFSRIKNSFVGRMFSAAKDKVVGFAKKHPTLTKIAVGVGSAAAFGLPGLAVVGGGYLASKLLKKKAPPENKVIGPDGKETGNVVKVTIDKNNSKEISVDKEARQLSLKIADAQKKLQEQREIKERNAAERSKEISNIAKMTAEERIANSANRRLASTKTSRFKLDFGKMASRHKDLQNKAKEAMFGDKPSFFKNLFKKKNEETTEEKYKKLTGMLPHAIAAGLGEYFDGKEGSSESTNGIFPKVDDAPKIL